MSQLKRRNILITFDSFPNLKNQNIFSEYSWRSVVRAVSTYSALQDITGYPYPAAIQGRSLMETEAQEIRKEYAVHREEIQISIII